MPWLAVGTTTRELQAGDVLVGSGPQAQWRVTTADLMPAHFVVTLNGTNASVRPNSGDNVVVVNGVQLVKSAAPLRDGDVILAGSGRFVFSLEVPNLSPLEEAAQPHGYLVDEQARVAHPLIGRSTPIGRDASNSIVVRDPTASRFHAEVRREAGGFALHSMGASGTTLNSRALEKPALLADGDTVEIAFSKLRFTTTTPSSDIQLATPHSTRNDETARKPTLDAGTGVVVDEENEAGRDTRRIQLLAALILALGIVVWFALR